MEMFHNKGTSYGTARVFHNSERVMQQSTPIEKHKFKQTLYAHTPTGEEMKWKARMLQYNLKEALA